MILVHSYLSIGLFYNTEFELESKLKVCLRPRMTYVVDRTVAALEADCLKIAFHIYTAEIC